VAPAARTIWTGTVSSGLVWCTCPDQVPASSGGTLAVTEGRGEGVAGRAEAVSLLTEQSPGGQWARVTAFPLG
jgi:hypothetical protein